MLTDKQTKYGQLVAQGMEPLDAAIGAGYSRITAEVSVQQLNANVPVQQYIEMLRNNPEVMSVTAAPPLPAPVANTHVPTIPLVIPDSGGDPVKFLESIMDNQLVDLGKRMDAAKNLLPYKAAKVGDIGKKGALKNKAANAVGGTFAPSPPPSSAAATH